ncbi:MAG: hypothetical protein WB565_15920 [Acidimicrobiales bacterium]
MVGAAGPLGPFLSPPSTQYLRPSNLLGSRDPAPVGTRSIRSPQAELSPVVIHHVRYLYIMRRRRIPSLVPCRTGFPPPELALALGHA